MYLPVKNKKQTHEKGKWNTKKSFKCTSKKLLQNYLNNMKLNKNNNFSSYRNKPKPFALCITILCKIISLEYKFQSTKRFR